VHVTEWSAVTDFAMARWLFCARAGCVAFMIRNKDVTHRLCCDVRAGCNEHPACDRAAPFTPYMLSAG
jgi:hypothetical protein